MQNILTPSHQSASIPSVSKGSSFKGHTFKSTISSTPVKSEVNSVCLYRTLNRMIKLWQTHDNHQWVALQHGPLLFSLRWGWLLPFLLTSCLTSEARNNGGKSIIFGARRTGGDSCLCYVVLVFAWSSVGYLITLGSSFLIHKRRNIFT